jgi:hypothetical protein
MTINAINAIAQYCMIRNALTESGEDSACFSIYPSIKNV